MSQVFVFCSKFSVTCKVSTNNILRFAPTIPQSGEKRIKPADIFPTFINCRKEKKSDFDILFD